MEKLYHQPITLASGSPRRKQLLEECGFRVDQQALNVEEVLPPGVSKSSAAEYLARLKGAEARSIFGPSALIVTADSVVIVEGEILGKPETPEEGRAMLRSLSDRTHEVVTAYQIQYQEVDLLRSVVSEVLMGPIDERGIAHYIDHYQPFDKAGGYGVQEFLGHCYVKRIEGSYTNIVGLPTMEISRDLRTLYDKFGIQ